MLEPLGRKNTLQNKPNGVEPTARDQCQMTQFEYLDLAEPKAGCTGIFPLPEASDVVIYFCFVF